MSTTNDELERRVEQLEQRVAELEQQVDAGSSGNDLDRYDGYVLDAIRENFDAEPSVKEMIALYEEAGVLDRQKIKRRHKRLKRSGRIETAVAGE